MRNAGAWALALTHEVVSPPRLPPYDLGTSHPPGQDLSGCSSIGCRDPHTPLIGAAPSGPCDASAGVCGVGEVGVSGGSGASPDWPELPLLDAWFLGILAGDFAPSLTGELSISHSFSRLSREKTVWGCR